ncbi:Phage related protein [Levilactobacillus hammesii DSM 16381]|uniref:Phage related protein n=1 Tax=Levilactobacillus hammesii DSM 16381 TaxID=1423753 RepID=A0A0R1UQT5_9LACO|nr:hypothetical protein [Levilactobacillus hammesii]KRL95567.1 Phage related protein [Levilactobacillus hammesii DSM 16381]
MKASFKQMGNQLTKLWFDRVTITGVKTVKDGAFTDTVPVVIVENEPAKVIMKGQKASKQTFFGTDAYDAKLLIRNGIKIPAGAEVDVTDVNGQVTHYKRASKGYAGYVSHQEVAMVRDEKATEEVE